MKRTNTKIWEYPLEDEGSVCLEEAKKEDEGCQELSGVFLMKIQDLIKLRFLHNPLLLDGSVLPILFL